MNSGLQGNAMRILGTTYGLDVGQIQTERANRFANLAQTETAAKNTLDTTLGAINSKYSGLISEYVQSQQQAAAERAQQQAQFNAQMAATKAASSGGASAGGSAVSRSGYNSDLSGLESALKGYQASGYKGAIPKASQTIAQLTGQYKGVISPQEISGYVKTLYSRYYLNPNT